MHSAFAGCGYVGRQVALRELADGGSVSAMVRTVDSADRLNEEGIVAVSADLDLVASASGHTLLLHTLLGGAYVRTIQDVVTATTATTTSISLLLALPECLCVCDTAEHDERCDDIVRASPSMIPRRLAPKLPRPVPAQRVRAR